LEAIAALGTAMLKGLEHQDKVGMLLKWGKLTPKMKEKFAHSLEWISEEDRAFQELKAA
jgi:hypothetical protein